MSEYIDRQAVIDLVDKGYLVSNANYGSVSRIVRQIPAADVAPVVHGEWGYRWKVHGDGRRPKELYPCSECGYENTSATNFCPNCGADMREES